MTKYLLIAAGLCCMVGASQATTYYIATGATACGGSACSDANNGTTKTTAWLHAPQMNGCTGNCASKVPQPGDNFIFRGGDTWGAANWTGQWFPDNGGTCGTSGNPVYFGVDQTWFAGGSYVRPIFSGGGTYPGTGTGSFVNFSFCGWSILDDIEFTAAFINQSATNNAYISCSSSTFCTNNIYENLYMHGWTIQSALASDVFGCIYNTTGNGTAHDNICSGADATIPTCKGTSPCAAGFAFYGGPNVLYRNYAVGIANFINVNVSGTGNFHDNYAVVSNDWDALTHDNVIQDNSPMGNSYIYNNLFKTIGNGPFNLNLHAGSGGSFYVFNNVYSDTSTVGFSLSTLDSTISTSAIRAFNNTIEPGPDSGSGPSNSCMIVETDATAITYSLVNNHCITSSTLNSFFPSGSCTGANCTLTTTTNLLQSKTTANAAGYTAIQTYPFSPTSGGSSTVGTGTNESSICSGMSDTTAKTACASDTTAGVAEISGQGGFVVSYPNRATNLRPSVAAWDIGAYQFGTPQASVPTFSPSAPYSGGATSVTISCATGPTACYANTNTVATDGATGCTSGTKYTAPIVTNVTTTYYAVCGGTSFTDSAVTGPEVYTISATGPDMKMSGLTVNGLTVTQ